MSRVGKHPIAIPGGVEVALADGVLTTKGKLGTLELKLSDAIEVAVEPARLVVTPASGERRSRVLWGTTRALLANMVRGVSTGYQRALEINGTGYRAQVQGKDLVLNLGYSHEVRYAIPEGIRVTCEKPTAVKVEGFDKRLVGQVAAEIRRFRPAEPYKGKGVKYQGEVIRRKEGKKK